MTAFHLMTLAFLLAMLNWFFAYRMYLAKCKEVRFLEKLLNINTNVMSDVLKAAKREDVSKND